MHDYKFNSVCIKVVDGDTIDCVVDLGFNISQKIRFRLARINAPEINSPIEETRIKAQEAKNFVSTSILSKKIIIESKKTEKYGRYLAEVFYDGKNLNDELLQQGLAEKYE